jgi:hypothetical protein
MHGLQFEVVLEHSFSATGTATAQVEIQVANLVAQTMKNVPN